MTALTERFSHAVVTFVGDDGYPVSAATAFRTDGDQVVLDAWSGPQPARDQQVEVTFSHIRPQPGQGYDERRYVDLWGRLEPRETGFALIQERSFGWDESDVPFFQYSEVTVPQAHRYLEGLGSRLGRTIKPRLAPAWLFLRATRLPFVTATIVPVLLGIAIAWHHEVLRPAFAGLTLLAALLVHLGLNVANDVFDAASGADEANETPTPFSGGSRVIQYGLVGFRTMVALMVAFYAIGGAIGLYLAWRTAFWAVVGTGIAGVAISIAYTAPPFRLVHRGLGEVAVAMGFGPVMTLGAWLVQTEAFAWEPVYASLPVALLIALVLYVNEVPDRAGDARAGKRTLPVRLSEAAVLRGYAAVAAAAYTVVLTGVVFGVMPVPTLLALATAPLARRVHRGLRRNYARPYDLMPTMARGIQLHVLTGVLLIAGYAIA